MFQRVFEAYLGVNLSPLPEQPRILDKHIKINNMAVIAVSNYTFTDTFTPCASIFLVNNA